MAKAIKDGIILGIDPGTTIMGYGLIKVENNKARMLAIGVLDLKKYTDHYQKLQRIFARCLSLIEEFEPNALAIEAPFFGKNVQSMLKLGRAQGAAIAAALYRDIPIFEYAPLKIKMALTGSGAASKEQVAAMLQRVLNLSSADMSHKLDATDGLAAAYCHFLQQQSPISALKKSSWDTYIKQNAHKVRGNQ